MATISLVDANRQWFKSTQGIDVCETSREIAFCAHAILQDDILLIPDAKRDPRVSDNPLVTGAPGIRFYAGAPLITEEGYRLGTLCVLDTKPHELTATQLSMLSDLAPIVVNQLEQRLLKERVAAIEQDRRAAEQSYAAIVASIREVVFQLSEDGRWTFINPAWTQISGYSAEETLGRDWLNHVVAEDRVLASEVLEACRNSREHCQALRLLSKDSSTIYMEMTVRRGLGSAAGQGFTGTFYDLTEHRRAEAEIRRAKLEAEKASRAKSDFLSRMSHEIRTPMNSLLGFSELLLETDLNEQQRSYVQIFHSNARSLLTLVNDILDLSKVEAGEMKIHLTAFNPASLAAETVALLRGSGLQKSVPIHLSVGAGVDATFEGDAAKIRQILINLLGNAVKFTTEGSIHVRVVQTAADEQTVLNFEVEDTGPGIAEESRASIFDEFVQVDEFVTRQHRGTGLGLAICRQFVALLGGNIGVESEKGKGSTFHFAVPVARCGRAEHIDKAVQHNAPVSSKPDLRRPRILIADDFEHNVLLCRAYLGRDFDVEVVHDGAAALELVKTQQFDVVLMDIQMPVMDGITATRRIREWERASDASRVAIIALTAHALEEEQAQTLAAGCDAHLGKPITKRKLLEAITSYIPLGLDPVSLGPEAPLIRSRQRSMVLAE